MPGHHIRRFVEMSLAFQINTSALICVLCGVYSLSVLPSAAADLPAFAHPDRIRFDGQCFTINGQDTLVYSGAFHYFRCPKPLWRDRFGKIKEAGFNTVETYVAWNWHER